MFEIAEQIKPRQLCMHHNSLQLRIISKLYNVLIWVWGWIQN